MHKHFKYKLHGGHQELQALRSFFIKTRLLEERFAQRCMKLRKGMKYSSGVLKISTHQKDMR